MVKKKKDITTQEVEKISALIRNHPSSPSTEPKSNNYKNNMIKKNNIDIKYRFTSSYCTNTQVAICTGPFFFSLNLSLSPSPSLHKYKKMGRAVFWVHGEKHM